MTVSACDVITEFAEDVLKSVKFKDVDGWSIVHAKPMIPGEIRQYSDAFFIDLERNGAYVADIDFYIFPPELYIRLCVRALSPCGEHGALPLDMGHPEFDRHFRIVVTELIHMADLLEAP